jgi:hypothetical protein
MTSLYKKNFEPPLIAIRAFEVEKKRGDWIILGQRITYTKYDFDVTGQNYKDVALPDDITTFKQLKAQLEEGKGLDEDTTWPCMYHAHLFSPPKLYWFVLSFKTKALKDQVLQLYVKQMALSRTNAPKKEQDHVVEGAFGDLLFYRPDPPSLSKDKVKKLKEG